MAYITLNKKSFFSNLDIIAKATKSIDKIALVFKDNAYGHGLEQMASLAKEYGIKKIVVCSDSEAKRAQNYFEYVLVLAAIPTVKSKKIRYAINTLESICKFPKGTLVELKVDTGMHRNGVKIDELKEAFGKIKDAGLILQAVFTHHKSADMLSSEWFWQNENFKKVKRISKTLTKEFGFEVLRFHSANSASLFRQSDFNEDMARVGMVVYGCMQLPSALHVEGFKPVLSLYANKNSSRELKKGDKIGYGGICEMHEDAIVSNYDFGYGDGFLRTCSNNYKTPQNIRLLGRISMDNSTFLTDKEELLIFDDARKIAEFCKTVSYEVLTSLKADIKRNIV